MRRSTGQVIVTSVVVSPMATAPGRSRRAHAPVLVPKGSTESDEPVAALSPQCRASTARRSSSLLASVYFIVDWIELCLNIDWVSLMSFTCRCIRFAAVSLSWWAAAVDTAIAKALLTVAETDFGLT